jgi:hypothetical protein
MESLAQTTIIFSNLDSHLFASLIGGRKDCTYTVLFPFLESVSSGKIHNVKRNLNSRRLADQ